MKPKTLHKHRPYELKITQVGKEIIVETKKDLAMKRLDLAIKKAKTKWNKINSVDEFLTDFKD